MSEFYILSIKHTGKDDDYLTLWRPANCGYTLYLAAAGKYTQNEVESAPGYYNDGRDKIAVPCHVVHTFAAAAMHRYDPGVVVPNAAEIWEALKSKRHRAAVSEEQIVDDQHTAEERIEVLLSLLRRCAEEINNGYAMDGQTDVLLADIASATAWPATPPTAPLADDLGTAVRFLEQIRDGAEDEWPALNEFLSRVSMTESHSGRQRPGEKSACLPADDRGIAEARSSERGIGGIGPGESIQSREPVDSNGVPVAGASPDQINVKDVDPLPSSSPVPQVRS